MTLEDSDRQGHADGGVVPLAVAPEPQPLPEAVGVVGSPSSTGDLTVDLVEETSNQTLLGDLVYTSHPITAGRNLLALATVGEIVTQNRWHEDPNMRGVLRVHGSLPHLSADGDVRIAKVSVQAVYDAPQPVPPFDAAPREAGGALGMSPTTGQPVYRVDEPLVQGLIARHIDDVVYLGHVYRSAVRLPMYARQFTDPQTDGAFHSGIFGRNGSGKTAFEAYQLALQMRHPAMSFFVFDPQGQWTHQRELPFDLQRYAREYGRAVRTLSVAETIRMPNDAPLLLDLLDETGFFPQLTMRKSDNRETAKAEFARLLRSNRQWADQPPDNLLRAMLQDLLDDNNALTRIYNSATPRQRFQGVLQTMLSSDDEFAELLRHFRPVHSLFSPVSPSRRARRVPLRGLIEQVLDPEISPKPYVVVDLSARTGMGWLDDDETKARLIRKVASELARAAEDQWRQSGDLLNCAVIFDEAARFAASHPEGEQAEILSSRLVRYARETRKTGLGWTFITQSISALNTGIYDQLTTRAYGYGMTTGSDLNRLRDEVGSGSALDLYKSFPDPRALADKVYPFMLTGPTSPLSFTAAPVFLQVYTSDDEFRRANRQHLPPRAERLW